MKAETYEILPVVPLRGLMVFPGETLNFDAGREKTVKAVRAAMQGNGLVFVVSQIDPRKNDILPEDIMTVGTICKIKQFVRLPGDSMRVLVEGIKRGCAQEYESDQPYFEAKIIRTEDKDFDETIAVALRRHIGELFTEYARISGKIPPDVIINVQEIADVSEYADAVAQHSIHDLESRQRVLEELNPIDRLKLVLELLTGELEVLRIDRKIAQQVRKQMDKNQKEYYLREQAKAIHKELGDGDESEVDAYRQRLEKKDMPAEVRAKVKKEIDRLAELPAGSHEAPIARTYIECMLDLPWSEATQDNTDIVNAKAILESDHYGMKKVKERILEYLAVARLTGNLNGQIICLVGPPGVGKTSIASSIARAIGRNFVRMSLGGIRDEAEIRGHRRTYIGAMPGRIIAAMRQAKTVNPLILFDEIDKLSSDYHGDPASAMLEVLDGAQNFEFRDHFLEVPYDLSKVMFITTANDQSAIPRPLFDRMEIINVPGYIEEEKVHIANLHLLSKQMKKHGLKKSMFLLPEPLLRTVISEYTAEAGVRELERTIAALCRKAACEIAEGKSRVRITKQKIEDYLGQPKYRHDMAEQEPAVGMVNGLAWTAAGGDTLVVEAQVMEGTGKLELTGHLGDVMQESARAAITYVRAHASEYNLEENFYAKSDLHIHVPEGAVPKDGPSAGITMVTAVVSAFTGIPVKPGVAMTGEVTLRGRVLPIGGLREKLLAAVRAGITMVIVPAKNRKDMEDVPQAVRDKLKIIYVDDVGAVLKYALSHKTESRLHAEIPAPNITGASASC